MAERIDAARAFGVVCALAALAAAGCERPEPRSFNDFVDDGLARDGTLARCNQDRDASLRDVECVNARRAAAAIAVREETARSEELQRESERKRAALRERFALQQQQQREAAAAAAAAGQAAYEAQWLDSNAPRTALPGASLGAAPGLSTISLPPDIERLPMPQAGRPVLEELTIPRPFRRLDANGEPAPQ